MTVDPNIIYLTLLAGLWLGATAVYITGTGLAELASVGLVVVSVVWLGGVNANWWAVLLLIVGVGIFLLTPLIVPRYGRYAVAGLGLQAAGGLFLLPNMAVSPILIVVTLTASYAYLQIVLQPILQAQLEQTAYDDAMQVVGMEGRVIKPLDPVGTVMVNGEVWTARSSHPIASDTEVLITEQVGLELRVLAKRHES